MSTDGSDAGSFATDDQKIGSCQMFSIAAIMAKTKSSKLVKSLLSFSRKDQQVLTTTFHVFLFLDWIVGFSRPNPFKETQTSSSIFILD
jgi:hypothetical protein